MDIDVDHNNDRHHAKLGGSDQAITPCIVVSGNNAWLSAELFERVRPVLEAQEIDFVRETRPNRRGRYRRRGKTVPYYLDQDGKVNRDQLGRFRVPAELVPRIVRHLAVQGQTVQVEDGWHPTPLAAAITAKLVDWPLTTYQRKCLHAVLSNPRGLIMTDSREEAVDLAVLLLAVRPTSSAAVVVENTAAVRVLKRQLNEMTDRVAMLYDDPRLWSTQPRILVCTPFTARLCRVEDFQLVVFADVDAALSGHLDEIFRNEGHRRYCFVPEGRQFTPRDQLKLEVLCGEIICQPEEQPDTDVRVYFADSPSSAADTAGLTPPQRKRWHIWRDDLRNDYVARIASAVDQQDLPVLRELGVLLDEDQNFFLRRRTSELGTVVLVEVPEHARELALRLPGWEVLDGRGLPMEGFNDFGGEWLETPKRAVITITKGNTASVIADHWIRADGTDTPWQASWGPQGFLSNPEMLVIDIQDSFDCQAARDARRRRRDYIHLG